MRRFAADLAREQFDDETFETEVVTDLANLVIGDAIDVLLDTDDAAGVELAILTEVAGYFSALPGQPLLVVFPPANAELDDYASELSTDASKHYSPSSASPCS